MRLVACGPWFAEKGTRSFYVGLVKNQPVADFQSLIPNTWYLIPEEQIQSDVASLVRTIDLDYRLTTLDS